MATAANNPPTYSEPTFLNEQEPFTDTGNGERLAVNHAQHLRYVPQWGWLYYATGAWRRDVDSTFVAEQAKATLRQMAAAHLGNGTKADQDNWHRHIRYSFNNVEKMVRSARTVKDVAAKLDAFDTDPWQFNCANGVLNLKTGAFEPHDPALLLAKQSPVSYDPTATCPTWQRFLTEIFCERPDLIRWVQKALGYSLTGSTREQVFFVCYGGGWNGKSVLRELIAYILGDYAKPLKADALMDNPYRNGSGADPELAALVGARYVSAAEPRERGRDKAPVLDTGRVKELTGGDTLQVRELYGMPFSFQPQFKLWLSVNNRPEVPENTLGIWRRIRLVPFEANFEGRADQELPDKLRPEAPGILNWLLAGCRLWQQEGLGALPQAVREATREYHEHEDEYAPFFDEVLCRDGTPGAYVLLEDAWYAFLDWRRDMDYDPQRVADSRALAKMAESHTFTKKRLTAGHDKGKRALMGCRLRGPEEAAAAGTTSDDGDDEYPFCTNPPRENAIGYFVQNHPTPSPPSPLPTTACVQAGASVALTLTLDPPGAVEEEEEPEPATLPALPAEPRLVPVLSLTPAQLACPHERTALDEANETMFCRDCQRTFTWPLPDDVPQAIDEVLNAVRVRRMRAQMEAVPKMTAEEQQAVWDAEAEKRAGEPWLCIDRTCGRVSAGPGGWCSYHLAKHATGACPEECDHTAYPLTDARGRKDERWGCPACLTIWPSWYDLPPGVERSFMRGIARSEHFDRMQPEVMANRAAYAAVAAEDKPWVEWTVEARQAHLAKQLEDFHAKKRMRSNETAAAA